MANLAGLTWGRLCWASAKVAGLAWPTLPRRRLSWRDPARPRPRRLRGRHDAGAVHLVEDLARRRQTAFFGTRRGRVAVLRQEGLGADTEALAAREARRGAHAVPGTGEAMLGPRAAGGTTSRRRGRARRGPGRSRGRSGGRPRSWTSGRVRRRPSGSQRRRRQRWRRGTESWTGQRRGRRLLPPRRGRR